MKNYNEICSVNREATSDNIRIIVQSMARIDRVAESLNVCVRTLNYWCSGKRMPSIDNLNRLAVMADVKLEDILVYNYQVQQINREDFIEYLGLARKRNNNEIDTSKRRSHHLYGNNIESINAHILSRVYHKQNLSVPSFEIFPLLLPLISFYEANRS